MRSLNIKFCFLVMVALVSCTEPEQTEFEGKIVYKVEVTSTNNSPFIEWLQHEMGDTAILLFKKDMYRCYLNGSPRLNFIFLGSKAEQYTEYENRDTLYVDDCLQNRNELFETKLQGHADTILGKMCEKFTMWMNDERAEFYYSPELHIPAEYYKNHQFGHVNTYYKNCKSPFLKRIQYRKYLTITYTAISIEKMSLSDSLFKPNYELSRSSLFKIKPRLLDSGSTVVEKS